MSETSTIVTPIVKALTKAGYLTLRLNSGKVRVRGGFMTLCPVGTADVVVFPANQPPLWVECKQPGLGKVKNPTVEAQQAFAERVLSLGHRHIQTTNLQMVLAVLEASCKS